MNKENKLRIGVIPAAGKGKRMGYLGHLLPKSLFPVYDRPLVHYVVNQMEKLGIEKIYIIVHSHKEKIIEYFDLFKQDIKAEIEFIVQEKLDGTGSAILLAKKFIDEPFMVIYGDDCTVTETLPNMIDLFFSRGNAVVVEGAVKEKDKNILRHTCSVNIDSDGEMIEILEKPEDPPYDTRGCGVYIFSPEIFKYIEDTPLHPIRKEKEITYTINALAKEGRAYAHILNGDNVNVNDFNELLKATLLVSNLRRVTDKVRKKYSTKFWFFLWAASFTFLLIFYLALNLK